MLCPRNGAYLVEQLQVTQRFQNNNEAPRYICNTDFHRSLGAEVVNGVIKITSQQNELSLRNYDNPMVI